MEFDLKYKASRDVKSVTWATSASISRVEAAQTQVQSLTPVRCCNTLTR